MHVQQSRSFRSCKLIRDRLLHTCPEKVKHIRSENGTNLVGAQKALNDLDKDRIQDSLLKYGIQWSFNPPAASHHGGVWEQELNSILYQQNVDEEGLQTIFCEVEAILNNRALYTVSSDPHDTELLTPNHILLLKSQPILPPGIFSQSDDVGNKFSIWLTYSA